jgi:inositol oxygenase
MIPEVGLKVIRYHSFYAWHTHGAYTHFMSPDDETQLEWAKRFSNSDLYSKAEEAINDAYIASTLKPLYQKLVEKYFPIQVLEW